MADDGLHRVGASADAVARALRNAQSVTAIEAAELEESTRVEALAALRAAHEQELSAAFPRRFARARAELIEPATWAEVAGWVGDDTPPNLVIVGPTGTGKTFLAAAVARAWCEPRREVPLFAPVVALLDQLRPDGPTGVMREAAGTALLVLDDVGAEKSTDWTLERLYLIVNERWMNEAPIVATTNLDLSAVLDGEAGRTLSRLVGGALVVALQGRDRRLG